MNNIGLLVSIAAFAVTSCFAQGDTIDESQKYYRLDFATKELEGGNVMNTRSYSMVMSNSQKTKGGSIRVGSKVPIQLAGQPQGMNNVQYFDLGVNIDCRSLLERGSQLLLDLSVEISSVAVSPEPLATSLPPVVRQNKWSSSVIIPVARPATIFSSDEPSSKRTMQIEVTATPIKQTAP